MACGTDGCGSATVFGREDAWFSGRLRTALPGLRRYAAGLCGSRSEADDLVQSALERAWRGRAQLADAARVEGWLRAIVMHVYLDEVRRRRVRPATSSLDDVAALLPPSVPSARREEALDVARALPRLSPEHRQILMLVGVEALTYGEAAAELGVPVGTVMSRLSRARAALRAAVAERAEAPAA